MIQFAVRRQQQQPCRVLVQPPDGHTANRGIFRRKQVHHRRLLLVARGGQQSGGFVQHHMPCQAGIQLFAVQQDFRVLPHLHGRVALHVPIHADTPAANCLLHLRPASLAQRHQHSVKPQHLPAPSRPSRRAGKSPAAANAWDSSPASVPQMPPSPLTATSGASVQTCSAQPSGC